MFHGIGPGTTQHHHHPSARAHARNQSTAVDPVLWVRAYHIANCLYNCCGGFAGAALEDRAREGDVGKVGRTSSSAEVQYLQRLVEKHGREYEKMARDRKGNVQQYTAGQLRRAIAKAGLDVDRIIV